MASLDLEDLVEPATVPALGAETGAEERADHLARERWPDDPLAEAEDVHVVVLDTLARRVGVVADTSAEARVLVDRDADTDAAAADQHAAIRVSLADLPRDQRREVRVVVGLDVLVGADVDDRVSESSDVGPQVLFEREAGVVATECHSQRRSSEHLASAARELAEIPPDYNVESAGGTELSRAALVADLDASARAAPGPRRRCRFRLCAGRGVKVRLTWIARPSSCRLGSRRIGRALSSGGRRFRGTSNMVRTKDVTLPRRSAVRRSVGHSGHRPAAAWIAFALASSAIGIEPPALVAEGARPAAVPETAPGPAKVRSEVLRELERVGRVVVFVYFEPLSPSGTSSWGDEIARVQDEILDAVGSDASVRVRHRFRWVPSLVLEVHDLAALARIAALAQVRDVYLDVPGRASMRESLPAAGVDRAHELGVDGSGTIVAVLDSGIEPEHPALESARLVEFERRFLDQGNDIGDDARDGHGHGTHVAGVIGSRGSTEIGLPAGVAPGARLIALKVLDDSARGWLSDWCRGMDEVLRRHLEVEGVTIDVVNMSLVLESVFEEICDDARPSFAIACRIAAENGIALFASSGNGGAADAITLPACYSSVTSVGSSRHAGEATVSSFTNRGELLDILAPGEEITSAGLAVQGHVSTRSGTSHACPHVAGVASLMREADGAMSASDLRAIVIATGERVADPTSGRSYPLLDARRAVELALGPAVEFLACDASGEPISVVWELTKPATSQFVRVDRDGEPFHSEILDGAARRFQVLPRGGGTYRTCVWPVGAGGFIGASQCCEVRVVDGPAFRRGDCTGDGWVDISDVVGVLWNTFATPELPLCLVACDANDDDEVDVSDAVYLLNYLFRRQAPPPPPQLDCGRDVSLESLGCAVSPCGLDA